MYQKNQKHPALLLKYKNRLCAFSGKFKTVTVPTYTFGVLTAFNLLLLGGLFSNLKLLVFSYLVVGLILHQKVKNLFVVSFTIFLYSLQFFVPNKYYVVEVIRGFEIDLLHFRDGYYLGYGVRVADILIVLTTILWLREVAGKPRGLSMVSVQRVMPVLLSGCVFLATAMYSTTYFSPFLSASLVWLGQYMYVWIVAVGVFFLWQKNIAMD